MYKPVSAILNKVIRVVDRKESNKVNKYGDEGKHLKIKLHFNSEIRSLLQVKTIKVGKEGGVTELRFDQKRRHKYSSGKLRLKLEELRVKTA